MKYISLETIQKARLATVSTPDALQAAYIDGWNDCIEALINHLPQTEDEITVSTLAEIYDNIFDDDDDEDGFLQALGGGQAEPADDVGIPDCEDCSFSGLLTED